MDFSGTEFYTESNISTHCVMEQGECGWVRVIQHAAVGGERHATPPHIQGLVELPRKADTGKPTTSVTYWTSDWGSYCGAMAWLGVVRGVGVLTRC